jgi:hypothetical protein
MVRRVKADCRDISERADTPPSIRSTNGVTAVFNEPEIMFFAECGDRIEIERITQRVGDHHRTCLL